MSCCSTPFKPQTLPSNQETIEGAILMRRNGWTNARIAKSYKVTARAVEQWFAKVRDFADRKSTEKE